MSTSPFVPATDRWGDRLPRRLGFWSAVAVLVGSTIGGGIFRTPAVIALRDDRWGTEDPAPVLVGATIGGGVFRTPAVIAERVPAPLPTFRVWVRGGRLS